MTASPWDFETGSARRALVRFACAALLSGATPGATLAQLSEAQLSVQATDPTASLMTVNLLGDLRTSYHGLDRSGFELRAEPVVPFDAWEYPNLLRLTVPYQASGPDEEGLKTVSILDLVLFDQDWGRFGIGPVMSLAESATTDEGKFGLGPAVAAVWQYSPAVQLGVLNQNLFGRGLAVTKVRPIIAYQMGSGWALSAGDIHLTYDWNAGTFVDVPIGFELGLVRSIVGQPMRFAVAPQWNLRRRQGTPESRIVFSAALLAPTAP